MKTNSKKIIVSTLALAMGASLAGSIAGSVAWYQYSTRAAGQIQGVSAGVTGDMAVSLNGIDYERKVVADPVLEYLPISVSGDSSALSYYGHPVYQYESLPSLGNPALVAPKVYSKEYTFTFRFYESDTQDAANAITPTGNLIGDKEVFLTYFEITGEFANAVRVEISAGAVAAVPGTALANGDDGADGVRYYTKAASSAGAGYLNDGTDEYTYAGTGDEVHADADNKYFPLTTVGRNAAVTPASGAVALANGADGADGVKYYTRVESSAGAGYLNDGQYAYTYYKTGDGTAEGVHADAENKYFTLTSVGSNGTYLLSANAAGETTTTSGNLDLNKDTRIDTDMWDCLDTVRVAAVPGTALANGEHGAADTKYYTKAASTGAGYHDDGTNHYVLAGEGTTFVATADDKYFPLTTEGVDGGDPIVYKNGTSTSYKTDAHATVKANAADAYDIDGLALAMADGSVELSVKVWLEGWAEIGGKTMWDLDTIGQSFSVNMQFACNANR